ncbi:Uncharacterised protein [Citrobacter koseri]|uniref:Uncharacterized protein n=1 Tax=Citrobacter koseri TaxID=545 RepID=A0A3S4I810_CITKO|nr:Uncharacterised protein [Citrobacter koseri]
MAQVSPRMPSFTDFHGAANARRLAFHPLDVLSFTDHRPLVGPSIAFAPL